MHFELEMGREGKDIEDGIPATVGKTEEAAGEQIRVKRTKVKAKRANKKTLNHL